MYDRVFIGSHSLEGFGGFYQRSDFNFENDKSTVILGINGAGKTTLMNSIFISIALCLNRITGFNKNELDISQNTVSIGKEYSDVESFIKITGFNSLTSIGYKITQNGDIEATGKFYGEIINQFSKLNANYESGLLPVFRFFRSEKSINIENTIVRSQQFNKIENRSTGYVLNYSRGLLIKEVTNFLINQINIENQAKIDKKDLEFETIIGKFLRNTLKKFTSTLYEQEVEIKVKPSKYSSGQSIIVSKENIELEFSQLSSGEKYVLGLVLELIYRSVILNPRLSDFQTIPGIILIDEVENHLHPRWQLTLIKALESCFPNIQFIVSTHSPLIASSVRKEQIIAISNFEQIPISELPDIYSGSANEILDKILHSNYQIDIYDKEKKEIEVLINKFDFDSAEKKLQKLKKELNSSPQWINDLEDKITFGKA